MALPSGLRVGPYEIQSAIGQGGMGEVYRARDTKLGRDVAIKILPDALLHDADRLARFEREARVLASFNHGNIAQIHGFEEGNGVPALVMELIEGPTLADRLRAGPLSVDESLAIARQIADALGAAHQQGIIHRDLKPANIKVRADGVVKVLDFGLAKALDAEPASPHLGAQDPTISPALTLSGVVLGTAAYMSPEQARGKDVDRRTDLWAFGCVLYEMLTGRRPFDGATTSDVIAGILERDPDWTALPANTPPAVRLLLRRSLRKDVKQRLDSAAMARIEIEEALSAPPVVAETKEGTKPQRARRASLMAAVAVVAATAGAAVTWFFPRGPTATAPVHTTRFAIDTRPDGGVARPVNNAPDLAVAADGSRVVYSVGLEGRLMVRSLDTLESQPLAGATNARTPFFSPDGRWIGFFDQRGGLKKIAVAGGPALTLGDTTGTSRGASWGPGNTIVFATTDTATGLLAVPAAGGQVTVLTSPNQADDEEDHVYPSHLPDDRGVLFTVASKVRTMRVAVRDTRSGTVRTLVRGSHPVYLESGYLVFVEASTLWAVRFDLATLAVVGEAVPVVQGLRAPTSFHVTPSGTLAYVAEARTPARTLLWVDRRGAQEPIPAPPATYGTPRLAPDDARAAYVIREAGSDLWVWDFQKQAETRITTDGRASYGVWMPDGQRVIFRYGQALTARSPAILARSADAMGSTDVLTDYKRELDLRPTAVTADGARLVLEQRDPTTGWDVVTMSMTGPARFEPLLTSRFDERNAVISPDGRWVAYDSNQSGREEVWVSTFPGAREGSYQVSSGGGRTPLWSRSGRELFYSRGNALYVVDVHPSSSFTASPPRLMFEVDGLVFDDRAAPSGAAFRMYDVSRDGQRFLVLKAASPSTAASDAAIVVVQNWTEELNRQVP